MYGIIDIGSNTMRLSCYRVVEKQLIPVFHKKAMAGLGGYVNEENCLTRKGICKAIDTLKDFKNIIMCVGLDQLYVIATASFRNVNNTEEIVRMIKENTGIEVNVLSGEEEAMYDFVGATHGLEVTSGMIVDIGGGSTELVSFEEHIAKDAESIPIGSLNMFHKFVENLFPTEKEEETIRNFVQKQLTPYKLKKDRMILGIGGTIRSTMKLYNDYYGLDRRNNRMDTEQLHELLRALSKGQKSEMIQILKIVPDRIHTVLPGMIILDKITQFYRINEIWLSAWGVREGYMLEKVL